MAGLEEPRNPHTHAVSAERFSHCARHQARAKEPALFLQVANQDGHSSRKEASLAKPCELNAGSEVV